MPSIRRTARRSAGATCPSPASRRVLTEDFFSIKWPRLAFRRRILPVPVTLNRAAAPRSVFIFGIWSILFLCRNCCSSCLNRRLNLSYGCFGGRGHLRRCRLGAVGITLRGLRLPGSPIRREHHHHVATVKSGFRLYLRGALHHLGDPVENLLAEFRVEYL